MSAFLERYEQARRRAALPDVQLRLAEARVRAVPIPWVAPMPGIVWVPFRRVHRRLIAEAAAERLHGLTPALESAGLESFAYELERMVRLLYGVADAPLAEAI